MRFTEFAPDMMIDRYVITLKNLIGRAAAKKVPSKMNWIALNKILKSNDASLVADYETFKSVYDQSPAIQGLVKNFDARGIDLNVPGAPDADEAPQDGTDSQAAVDKTAAAAAPQQLAQQTS
jgi:hypothetical protein|tara:strand:+ start:2797 stop:3162 length:366 start_codon:yes stop_codon:yes gene_type:complete